MNQRDLQNYFTTVPSASGRGVQTYPHEPFVPNLASPEAS